jgi:hypothetical protein
MSSLRIQITPELLAEAKHLFEETSTPRQDIAAMMGISLDTLRQRSGEWGWQCRQRQSGARACMPAIRGGPGNLLVVRKQHRGFVDESLAAARRRAAASRIMTMLEDELARIENTFKEVGACAEGAFDNRIRTLLGVTKTLREVELMSKSDEVIPPDAADNDATRDIDEFREALARRIESFAAAQQNANGGTDDGAIGGN